MILKNEKFSILNEFKQDCYEIISFSNNPVAKRNLLRKDYEKFIFIEFNKILKIVLTINFEKENIFFFINYIEILLIKKLFSSINFFLVNGFLTKLNGNFQANCCFFNTFISSPSISKTN